MMLPCVDKCEHGPPAPAPASSLPHWKLHPNKCHGVPWLLGQLVRCQGLHLLLFPVRSGFLVVPTHHEMAHTWCLSRGTWLEGHQAQGGRE